MVTTEEIVMVGGVLLAAVFWIVTQWNVIRVGKQLKAVQADAREHADQVINQTFQRMEATIDSKISQIRIPEIPEVDDIDFTEAVNTIEARTRGLFTEFGTALKAEILEASKASAMALQSGFIRSLNRELGALDGDLTDLAEGTIAELAQSADPMDLLAGEIINTRPSKAFQKDHPVATLMLSQGKMQFIQQMRELRAAQQGISTQKAVATSIKTSPFGD
jgi:hypothetical protein